LSGRRVHAEVKDVRTTEVEDHPGRFSPTDPTGSNGMEGLALAVQERLYPFVSNAIRDGNVVEDVLQDVIVVLIEQRHLLRRPECFWPWVYRIAWSKVQDHFRDHRRARRIAASGGYEPACPEAATGDLLDAMVRREAVEQLTIAFDRLNPRCRVVLYLRFHEQMPYDEIASVMHSTPGQVRVQFHRAKRLLRDSLLSSCA
jgi:RNA polymerase sigma-70 factor (ECF subfamily)